MYDFEFGFTTDWVWALALTTTKASQKSWCVIKLSFLQKIKKPKQLQQSQNPSKIALTNWNLNQTSKAKQKPEEQSPTAKASQIPQPKQASSVSIYTPCGKEDRNEGNQLGSRYCETVEQKGE